MRYTLPESFAKIKEDYVVEICSTEAQAFAPKAMEHIS